MESLEFLEPTPIQTGDSLQAQIETLLFATPRPLTINDILEFLGDETLTFKDVKNTVQQIVDLHSARPDAGFYLECTGVGQFQFRTKPQFAYIAEKLFSKRPRPLSRAAQETLAIVAYRQPVSRADIEFIRGTDSGSIIKNLLERDLIRCVGRKDIPGKPMLFGTTEEFLRVYRLAALKELPSLESFQPRRETLKFATELPKDVEEPSELFELGPEESKEQVEPTEEAQAAVEEVQTVDEDVQIAEAEVKQEEKENLEEEPLPENMD